MREYECGSARTLKSLYLLPWSGEAKIQCIQPFFPLKYQAIVFNTTDTISCTFSACGLVFTTTKRTPSERAREQTISVHFAVERLLQALLVVKAT